LLALEIYIVEIRQVAKDIIDHKHVLHDHHKMQSYLLHIQQIHKNSVANVYIFKNKRQVAKNILDHKHVFHGHRKMHNSHSKHTEDSQKQCGYEEQRILSRQ